MADRLPNPDPGRENEDYPGAPRWVKAFGLVLAIVLLLILVLTLTGGPDGHGPGRHLRLGDGGSQAPASGTTRSPTYSASPGVLGLHERGS